MNRAQRLVAEIGLVACLCFRGAPVGAEGLQSGLDLHGFGSWAYGNTNGNVYLAGDQAGRYDDTQLALNVVAAGNGPLRIVAQADWQDGPEGTAVELDYAFAEWVVSDRVRLRAGKVKQPFGISAEVIDVGTLRPFVKLPQAVYGPAGLVGQSFKGVGLTGSASLRGGWTLLYDLYGGGQDLKEFLPPEAVVLGEEFEDPIELERTRDMVGGRLLAETSLPGLTIGASAYTGSEIGSNRRTGLGFQASYASQGWSIRSEYVRETVKDDLEANGAYLEAAYRIDPHWQLALQFGRFTSDVLEAPTPAAPSLLDHREFAAGVNYWWNSNFVFKVSYHHVKGNRFAGPEPEDLAEAAASGSLKEKTSLFLVGSQFSF